MRGKVGKRERTVVGRGTEINQSTLFTELWKGKRRGEREKKRKREKEKERERTEREELAETKRAGNELCMKWTGRTLSLSFRFSLSFSFSFHAFLSPSLSLSFPLLPPSSCGKKCK